MGEARLQTTSATSNLTTGRVGGMVAGRAAAEEKLAQLRSEYRELEAASEECDASDAISLKNAELERLKVSSRLQRYREQQPPPDDIAKHYEAEIAELVEEVFALREEHFLLADDQRPAAVSLGGSHRSALAELSDEVQQLWRRRAEHHRRCRQAQLDDWRLGRLRSEARRIVKELKSAEEDHAASSSRHEQAHSFLSGAEKAARNSELELEHERLTIRELHMEASGLREACNLPARMKRESSFLIRMLDQEGGRLKTKRHQQGLQLCKKLYDEVAVRAPALLPVAGRARTEMEAEFKQYLELEENHSKALQRLHLTVTKGLIQ